MTEKKYQEAAAEFLDLWQKQISTLMVDKKFIQVFLDMFQNAQNKTNTNYEKSTASNSATTPDARDDLLAQLAFRLASCEKRIAALEAEKLAKPRAKRTAK